MGLIERNHLDTENNEEIMKENQKNWLLEAFFRNDHYAGWRSVAEKLIDTGSCITTDYGNDIWKGGVGNFIDSEHYPEGFNCVKLTFDVKSFCSKDNKFFMEYYEYQIEKLNTKVEEAEHEFFEIKNIITN